MSEDRWVRIVDPEHVYRAGIDEVWHPVYYPQRWSPVIGLDRKKCDWHQLYKVRCRLRDVPPGTKIVDPGEGYELVEPWEIESPGVLDYWSSSTQSWKKRAVPQDVLAETDIYRRPIRVIYPDQFAAATAAFRKAMEVSKTPQPGEWWFEDDGSDRVFIHGMNVKGQAICEWKFGGVSADDDWQGWHHEPACTGWDWQPSQPEAEPEPLTLEQRVEAMEERLKKLEHQVSEWEGSQ